MKLVLKLGGHLIPLDLSKETILAYSGAVKKIHSKGDKIVMVVGGGEMARRYINTARSLGADESLCDLIGIEVTRLNARLFISEMGDRAYPVPPTHIDELKKGLLESKIIVMGGLQPGQSTDAVAALAAEAIDADLLIIATDVDGIYTEDPKVSPSAKRIEEITPEDLLDIIAKRGHRAGEYELLDVLGLEVIKRSRITTHIIDGRDPKNIVKVWRGEKVGSVIRAP
ncbi:MAG: UMP kinase [Candidatus Bathyarchaeia archaeon]